MINIDEEQKNILTKEGVVELKEELNHLIEVERPHVIGEIKDARDQGDLSENAEYDAARERQGVIEDRIKEIENILANSEVLSNSSTSKKIRIGSTVTIAEVKNGVVSNETSVYRIVGSLEANPFESLISNESPLAEALLGAGAGQTVSVDSTHRYEVKIIEVK